MGCCTGRCLLITICTLQFVATIERLVFDFLGYMWAPIIGGFLQIIFIIMGTFGAVQYRPRVLIVYCMWLLIWLGWNIFVICLYLEVGDLTRDSVILNVGTGHKSWWLENGMGCEVSNTEYLDPQSNAMRQSPPEEDVTGCLLDYQYVEVIHAGVQCILALMGFTVACYVIYLFTEEDDSSQPVHDELEYIKMRYKSPARISYRDNRTYETLTTRSGYSTVDRGVDGPNLNNSDDSFERLADKPHRGKRAVKNQKVVTPDKPWGNVRSLPQQTSLEGFTEPIEHSYTYNIIGETRGVTVI